MLLITVNSAIHQDIYDPINMRNEITITNKMLNTEKNIIKTKQSEENYYIERLMNIWHNLDVFTGVKLFQKYHNLIQGPIYPMQDSLINLNNEVYFSLKSHHNIFNLKLVLFIKQRLSFDLKYLINLEDFAFIRHKYLYSAIYKIILDKNLDFLNDFTILNDQNHLLPSCTYKNHALFFIKKLNHQSKIAGIFSTSKKYIKNNHKQLRDTHYILLLFFYKFLTILSGYAYYTENNQTYAGIPINLLFLWPNVNIKLESCLVNEVLALKKYTNLTIFLLLPQLSEFKIGFSCELFNLSNHKFIFIFNWNQLRIGIIMTRYNHEYQIHISIRFCYEESIKHNIMPKLQTVVFYPKNINNTRKMNNFNTINQDSI